MTPTRPIRAALSTLALVLLAGGGSGCGMMRMRSGDVERVDPWPFAERVIAGQDPEGNLRVSGPVGRPTALVRIDLSGVAEALAQGQEPVLDLRRLVAPFHSGLFGAVGYQHGVDRRQLAADYLIDLKVGTEEVHGWYTWVGAVTLGCLPFGVEHRLSVDCIVRDGQERPLGEPIHLSDGLIDVYWLPFLVLNVAFNALDVLGAGTALGLSREGWEAKQKAVHENTMRAVMLEVARRVIEVEAQKRAPPIGPPLPLEGPAAGGDAPPGEAAPAGPSPAPGD